MILTMKEEQKSNKKFNLSPEERKYFEDKAKKIDLQKKLYHDIMKSFDENYTSKKTDS